MVYERHELAFLREMEVNKLSEKDFEKIKEIVAVSLGVDEQDVEVIYFYKFPDGFETKIRVKKEVGNNFSYIVSLSIISRTKPKILIEGKVKKIFAIPTIEKVMEYPSLLRDLIENIYSSITFKDYLSKYKNELEDICKRIYEEIEIYLGLRQDKL